MAKIVLGITGSIAAYKACDIIREFKKKNNEVICIMTSAAKEFITPLTLATLSENPVYDDIFYFSKNYNSKIKHIDLSQDCDLILVVPATANIIGKIASGIADDLLTATVMASKKPVLFAPAMNKNMWENNIVKENVVKLKKFGYKFVGPKKGLLACGDYGDGHIEDTEKIVNEAISLLKKKSLKNKTVLILSGPTAEKIDDIRYITNASSGKTGFFLANEAKARGANVIFITGKTDLIPDADICQKIESANDMFEMAKKYFKKSDIIISAAAVGDFTVEKIDGKIPREKNLNLKLKPTKDILGFLGVNKKNKKIIGFSAEIGNNLKRAKEKIKRKNLDFIVVNDVTKKDCGFGSDHNDIIILNKKGKVVFSGGGTKEFLAEKILDCIE